MRFVQEKMYEDWIGTVWVTQCWVKVNEDSSIETYISMANVFWQSGGFPPYVIS